ncbi:GTP cyclohydrolase N terminal-domain-containing protein [Dipodascopsis tothii]|uniref:GTP cyclohydrolase N terminal-domain-containing protein n=1 Tax=Dipodascopsis tothii TaxID=44089 RepID=UPI0034CDA6AE
MCPSSETPDIAASLGHILTALQSLQSDYKTLSAKIASSDAQTKATLQDLDARLTTVQSVGNLVSNLSFTVSAPNSIVAPSVTSEPSPPLSPELLATIPRDAEPPVADKTPAKKKNDLSELWGKRVVLATYPGQSGINPLPLKWGAADPRERGPIVVSRLKTSMKLRNAIGAHSGSYGVYHALAVAISELKSDHKADFTNTEPAVTIGPYPQWGDAEKIVSMDPFGHLAPWLYKDYIDGRNIEIRPSIAVTKAHMQLAEIAQEVKDGTMKVDGKIVLNEQGDLAVTKFAVEPVWYLPGVAKRFGVDEGTLRRALFEDTGGSYPELITRPDIKVFLPPIGGMTAYVFGDPKKMSDPNCRLALRVHDECNGSDVFGSDICTCRPYLIFGISEAVKEAQAGGSGVVIYFRKEGRALGEVTKYLVYNARKRMGDSAAEYFTRTENIAGVKDMRFQALMPDILHFLGIKKIDRMLSMSNMKHDAIVSQGIPIYERVPIPDELIPPDSRVEIDAKIHAGYFTDGKIPSLDDLTSVKGRQWEDIEH